MLDVVVVAAVSPVVADVVVVGTSKNEERRGEKKKTEKEPGRHNYKLHRYTQITRLFCASQPPSDHTVYVSSVVAREQRGKRDGESKKHQANTTKMREEEERERKRESLCARAAHNYRLYFQIAACELAASSNCSRHWIFIARAIPSWHGTTRSECQLSTGQILVIIDMERTGRYAFVLNPFKRNFRAASSLNGESKYLDI